MTDDQGIEELESIRHDLLNLLTALRSGCTLIEARLSKSDTQAASLLLGEVREELDKGRSIAERLKAVKTAAIQRQSAL